MTAEFDRLAGQVATNIQKLVNNVSSMQRMVQHVDTQGEQLQKQLSQLHHYTGQLAKDTAQQLMKIGDIPNLDAREKMQKERLQDDFGKALNSFQRLQTEAAERERAKLAAARQHKVGGGDEGILPPPSYDQATGESKQSRTQMMIQEEGDLQALQERESAIRQLESDIVDVNTIFKDLATMVHEQGDIVDSIESNIEAASVQVTDGNDQLRQAYSYQTSARKKKLILGAVGIVILVILVVIIAVEASK
jgi:syntaxin 7